METAPVVALFALVLIGVFGGIAHLVTGLGASAERELDRAYRTALNEGSQTADREHTLDL